MTEKTKKLLSLNHTEAMDFFLKSEQYHGFELPRFFMFDKMLQNLRTFQQGRNIGIPQGVLYLTLLLRQVCDYIYGDEDVLRVYKILI